MDCGLCAVEVQGRKEGSSSFLKKRTKKLLFVWHAFRRHSTQLLGIKSFLVLFFKKELLPS
jgi:hypothetical protein